MRILKNIKKEKVVKYGIFILIIVLSVAIFANQNKGFFDAQYMGGDDPVEKSIHSAGYIANALIGIITLVGLAIVNKNNFNWVETIMVLVGGFFLFLVAPTITKRVLSGNMIDADMVQSSISYTAVKAESLKHILSENMIDTDMVQSCISCTTEKVNSFIS